MMERLAGVGASPGIAIGKGHVLGSRVDVHERRIAVEAVEAEIARFETAIVLTDAQLARIQDEIAEREHDGHQYRILEAHRMMLQDVHLVEVARKIIREDQTGAEWAVMSRGAAKVLAVNSPSGIMPSAAKPLIMPPMPMAARTRCPTGRLVRNTDRPRIATM